MAESKQRNGFDDQEDETRFQSGPASFLLVVIKQVRETATLIPECNPIDTLKLARNIVEMSNTLEYYIKIDETRDTKKEQTISEYSRLIRKMKKKRKLFYYYRLKNEKMAEIYKEYCNKNEITVPSHLVPKLQPEETKQEYQLRVEHAKEKLKQEIQILEPRRDTYEKKTKMMDNEIDNMIMTKYDKHHINKEYFRNKWIEERKTEEFKSSRIWQPKEAYIRSKMYTLKANANPVETQSKRGNHKLTKTKSRRLENTGSERLIESNQSKLRGLEHEYIKEFEKKMHAAESGITT